jgi:hypothetical protein
MAANIRKAEADALMAQKLAIDFGNGVGAKYAVNPGLGGSYTLNETVQDAGGTSSTREVFVFIKNNGDYDVIGLDEMLLQYQNYYSKAPGGIEAFRKSLYLADKITEQEYKSKSINAFLNAITTSAREHSVEVARNYSNSGRVQLDSLNTYLKMNKVQPAGPDITRQLTDPKQAVQDLNAFTQDYLSRPATPEEQKEYKKLLRAEEISTYQKRVTTKTGNVTSTDYIGDVLNQEDYMRIMGKVLKKSIAGTDVDQLLTGTGTLAQNVSAIREYASEMGIKMDGKEALNYATSNLKSGNIKNINNIDSVKLQIKEMAKYLYPSLAAGIDAGVTPGKIGREVGSYMEEELEQPAGTYGIFNSEVADYVANGTPRSVIKAAQRKKAAFAGTDKASNEATDYLNTILKSFGLM